MNTLVLTLPPTAFGAFLEFAALKCVRPVDAAPGVAIFRQVRASQLDVIEQLESRVDVIHQRRKKVPVADIYPVGAQVSWLDQDSEIPRGTVGVVMGTVEYKDGSSLVHVDFEFDDHMARRSLQPKEIELHSRPKKQHDPTPEEATALLGTAGLARGAEGISTGDVVARGKQESGPGNAARNSLRRPNAEILVLWPKCSLLNSSPFNEILTEVADRVFWECKENGCARKVKGNTDIEYRCDRTDQECREPDVEALSYERLFRSLGATHTLVTGQNQTFWVQACCRASLPDVRSPTGNINCAGDVKPLIWDHPQGFPTTEADIIDPLTPGSSFATDHELARVQPMSKEMYSRCRNVEEELYLRRLSCTDECVALRRAPSYSQSACICGAIYLPSSLGGEQDNRAQLASNEAVALARLSPYAFRYTPRDWRDFRPVPKDLDAEATRFSNDPALRQDGDPDLSIINFRCPTLPRLPTTSPLTQPIDQQFSSGASAEGSPYSHSPAVSAEASPSPELPLDGEPDWSI